MLSTADVTAILEIRRRSSVTLSGAQSRLRLLRDCCALSSGTLSTLTGVRRYDLLDEIHGDFVLFVKALIPRRNWRTWVEAWREFSRAYGSITAERGI